MTKGLDGLSTLEILGVLEGDLIHSILISTERPLAVDHDVALVGAGTTLGLETEVRGLEEVDGDRGEDADGSDEDQRCVDTSLHSLGIVLEGLEDKEEDDGKELAGSPKERGGRGGGDGVGALDSEFKDNGQHGEREETDKDRDDHDPNEEILADDKAENNVGKG